MHAESAFYLDKNYTYYHTMYFPFLFIAQEPIK